MSALVNACESRRTADGRDERGEVFPVTILYLGVMLTVLLGVHVVLASVARSAVQHAADSGLRAAQSALPTECPAPPPTDAADPCAEKITPSGTFRPGSTRQGAGVAAAMRSMSQSTSMATHAHRPAVRVREEVGIVSVVVFGAIQSPVLGAINVVGKACGPLDDVADDSAGEARKTQADLSQCGS